MTQPRRWQWQGGTWGITRDACGGLHHPRFQARVNSVRLASLQYSQPGERIRTDSANFDLERIGLEANVLVAAVTERFVLACTTTADGHPGFLDDFFLAVRVANHVRAAGFNADRTILTKNHLHAARLTPRLAVFLSAIMQSCPGTAGRPGIVWCARGRLLRVFDVKSPS